MSSISIESHLMQFAHFDSYTSSGEEEQAAPMPDAPKPVMSAPKRKNKVTKKRKRVGRACVFCQRSHMSCDEQRPCKRCVARGCGDQCRDGKRKRRGRKRKTPLPDDEDVDDEFDEFEPVDKLLKDESDTEDEVEDEHAHCHDIDPHHGHINHNHHHGHGHGHGHAHAHAHLPTQQANQQYNIQLFEDEDEENSLSASTSSVPLMAVKREFGGDHQEMPLPSRPTTPALPVPMRSAKSPRLTIVSNASIPTESSSPATHQQTFDSLYPNIFEASSHSHETSSHTASAAPSTSAPSAIDVDSFFAPEPAHGGSRMTMNFFEEPQFGLEGSDMCF